MAILLILAFMCGATLLLGVASLVQKPAAHTRLSRFLEDIDDGAALRAEAAAPKGELLEQLLRPFAKLTAGSVSDAIREKLVQAGFRGEGALTIYMGGRLAFPAVGFLLSMLVCTAFGLDGLNKIGVMMALTGPGMVGPSYYLDKQRKKRQKEVRQTLPDALDLLVVCLESGLGMSQAISRVATEFVRRSPVLCEELRLVTAEMQAGKTSVDALRSLVDRVGITEVSSLVAMLIQTERFGTSVSEALRVHTDSMRIERLHKAEEMAQKSSTKMILPTLIFIFPAVILMAVGPAVLGAMDTLRGL